MTAGYGNPLKKFDDPHLEKSVETRLAPEVELTDEIVTWTKGAFKKKSWERKYREVLTSFRKSFRQT